MLLHMGFSFPSSPEIQSQRVIHFYYVPVFIVLVTMFCQVIHYLSLYGSHMSMINVFFFSLLVACTAVSSTVKANQHGKTFAG